VPSPSGTGGKTETVSRHPLSDDSGGKIKEVTVSFERGRWIHNMKHYETTTITTAATFFTFTEACFSGICKKDLTLVIFPGWRGDWDSV